MIDYEKRSCLLLGMLIVAKTWLSSQVIIQGVGGLPVLVQDGSWYSAGETAPAQPNPSSHNH